MDAGVSTFSNNLHRVGTSTFGMRILALGPGYWTDPLETRNIAIPIIAPAIPDILQDFSVTDDADFYQTMILTVWLFGLMLGPLLLGPFSEIYGRLMVYHVSIVLFIIFSIAAALSVNVGMLAGFRFLMGVVTVSPSLNPAVVGDLFEPAERGRAMAAVNIAPLLGTVVGPTMGGYISASWGWRWTCWIVTILTGAFEVALLLVLRETYRTKILQRRAEKLGVFKSQRTTLNREQFRTAIIRPLKMLFLSPVVFLVSFYVALVYAYIYFLAATLTEIFEATYHFNQSSVGLSYLGIGKRLPFEYRFDVYIAQVDESHSRCRLDGWASVL